MTTWRLQDDVRWRNSLVWAGGLHLVLMVLMVVLPQVSFQSKPQEIQFVRLMGGGDRTPGWITPTERQVTQAATHDGLPVQPRPQVEQRSEPAPEQETVPALQEERTKPSAREEQEEAVPPPPPVASESSEEAVTDEPTDAASGSGVARSPGPEGPGRGATTDAQFAGADRYMLSVEAEVNKNFRYRSRGGRQVSAMVHFYINRRGDVEELVLRQASGIPSLDQAAQSAVKRAGFPPLPGAYRPDRLGITYRFYNLQK